MLPLYKSNPQKIKQQDIAFGGLNLSDGAKPGELRGSKNLTSDRFPYLSTRKPRDTVNTYARPTALFGWRGIVVVDGTDLIYNGEVVGTVSIGEKQFAVVNTKLCIFPDKKYLDLTNNEFKSLEAVITSAANTSVFTTNSVQMNLTPHIASQSSSYIYPVKPKVKVYSNLSWTAEGGWVKTGEQEVDVTAVTVGQYLIPTRIAASGALVLPTKTGDGEYTGTENTEGYYYLVTAADDKNCEYRYERWTIWQSGGYWDMLNFYDYVYGAIDAYTDRQLDPTWTYAYWHKTRNSFDGTMTLTYDVKRFSETTSFLDHFKAGDIVNISGCTTYPANNMTDLQIKTVEADKLTFETSPFAAGTDVHAVTVSRLVPVFSYICEKDNRLWGIEGQNIRCSALGDPTNFNEYVGVSTDSYAVAVGTDGDFTGICAYSGELLCWKEDKLHKILGRYPAEYDEYTYDIDGLQAGGHKSMQIINEVLYYKSRNGICVYTSSASKLISYDLGMSGYANAVSGTDKIKYVVSMQDNTGAWRLFVYDTIHGVWLEEDNSHIVDFAFQNGHLYHLNPASCKVMDMSISGDEGAISWEAQLVEFTEQAFNKKSYTKLFIRAEMGDSSFLKIETSVDGGPFKQAYITSNEKARTITIPLLPVRCDEMKIKLSGSGQCVIKGLEREFTAGSEL